MHVRPRESCDWWANPWCGTRLASRHQRTVASLQFGATRDAAIAPLKGKARSDARVECLDVGDSLFIAEPIAEIDIKSFTRLARLHPIEHSGAQECIGSQEQRTILQVFARMSHPVRRFVYDVFWQTCRFVSFTAPS